MPLQIVCNDITKMNVDAIVNAANETLLGGGGVDEAIHNAAGPGLLEECKTLGGCKTGMAKITGGYNLPAKYVIHTVGPIYKDSKHREKSLLESCYRESLALAKEAGCKTVAFPLISSGAFGYPMDEALKIASEVIGDFVLNNEMEVYIVVYNKSFLQIIYQLFSDIALYIYDNYIDEHTNYLCESIPISAPMQSIMADEICECKERFAKDDLELKLKQIDESFSQMLLRKIDEKGMTDAQVYKKANIDRKLFSKIRSDVHYKPSKPTAIAFAISLELSLEETKDMLKKAGFALSCSNKFDIIIEYFITKGNYNIFEINQALFSFDQSLLGA